MAQIGGHRHIFDEALFEARGLIESYIANYDWISRWLNVEPVITRWRSTPFKEYIFYDCKLYFMNSRRLESEEVDVSGNPLMGLT